ncbi:hypothetical protein VHEMI05337 [[Torrubiella] hemipterigena]|uniref:Uncharacterized protein n=1 Tax=[Torrubiella] hemipterigena TaxID=1531966 RepID=A0A0A1SXN8_9HYPO|nr:hypothetical protein VHEMI05337 [[Torrubiella] hemipterigena]
MASLAASVRFSPLRQHIFSSSPRFSFTSCARSRFLSTTVRCRAAQSVRPPPPSPAARASATAAPSRYAFIKSLATKPTPTILYEGPSHFWFYFGCWSSGISILTWTVLTGPTVVQQPEGVPEWVSYVYGATYVLLGSMGFYLISKTPSIVHSIRVMPPSALAGVKTPTTTSAAGKAASAVAAAAQQPQIEVKVKRMLPILGYKTITTSLDNVVLKTRFSLPEEFVPQLKRLEAQRAEEAKRAAQWKFDKEHLLTLPFRHLARGVSGFFQGVRAAWTDMGYGVIKVNGKAYKVDVTQGFAHDGFKTLERLVQIGA